MILTMFRLDKMLGTLLDRRKPVVVVVLGHQKGGTTAIARLLGSMCDMPVSVDPFYAVDRGRARAVDRIFRGELALSKVARRHPSLFWQPIVKEPDFTFLWREVIDLYPQARFVYVARDPLDSIRSILKRLDLPGNPSPGPLPRMRNPTRHWELILSGRLPEVVGDDYVDRLARRWQLAVDTYTEHRDQIVLVRYEDFLSDKVAELARLARDLELAVKRDVSAEVDVSYQHPGDSEVDLLEFFGPQRIEHIATLCARGMQSLGYSRQLQSWTVKKPTS